MFTKYNKHNIKRLELYKYLKNSNSFLKYSGLLLYLKFINKIYKGTNFGQTPYTT